MLGLRPRLRARPSLLDLVRRSNAEHVSTSPARIPPLEADDRPLQIPLPKSPLLSPQEVESVPHPPRYLPPHEESKIEKKERQESKMAPVSCAA